MMMMMMIDQEPRGSGGLREEEELVRPTCKHAGATLPPYHMVKSKEGLRWLVVSSSPLEVWSAVSFIKRALWPKGSDGVSFQVSAGLDDRV